MGTNIGVLIQEYMLKCYNERQEWPGHITLSESAYHRLCRELAEGGSRVTRIDTYRGMKVSIMPDLVWGSPDWK